MNRRTPTEIDIDVMRERILDAAEIHFRRIGHRKTSVADIAACLGMSTANIYRFFPSRSVIDMSVCGRFLAQRLPFANAIARIEAPAQEKLFNLLVCLHRNRKTVFLEGKTVHDLVIVAMAENWAVVKAYSGQIEAIIEMIVTEGIEAREFDVDDAGRAARNVMNACTPFYHPVLVEEQVRNGHETETSLREQIRFCLKALGGTGQGRHCREFSPIPK